jgi:hypothetical protein
MCTAKDWWVTKCGWRCASRARAGAPRYPAGEPSNLAVRIAASAGANGRGALPWCRTYVFYLFHVVSFDLREIGWPSGAANGERRGVRRKEGD